jgi:hypothetical protein
VPEEVAIKRALFYLAGPDCLPCPLHPTAPYTILPILTLHKTSLQKTIKTFFNFLPVAGS